LDEPNKTPASIALLSLVIEEPELWLDDYRKGRLRGNGQGGWPKLRKAKKFLLRIDKGLRRFWAKKMGKTLRSCGHQSIYGGAVENIKAKCDASVKSYLIPCYRGAGVSFWVFLLTFVDSINFTGKVR